MTELHNLFGRINLVLQQYLGMIVGALARAFTSVAAEPQDANQATARPQAPTIQQGQVDAPTQQPVPSYHLNRILMAVIFSILFVVLGVADWQVLVQTMDAMGFGTGTLPTLPFSLDMITGLGLIAVAITWGLLILDMFSATHLLPDKMTKGRWRRALLWVSGGFMTLLVGLLVTVGIWRGMQQLQMSYADSTTPIAENFGGGLQPGIGQVALQSSGNTPSALDNQPDDAPATASSLDTFNYTAFNAAFSVLVVGTSAIAFTGVIYLFKYLFLLLLGAILAVFGVSGLLTRATEQVIASLFGALIALFNWFAGMGQRLVDTFGPPLHDLITAMHRRVHQALHGNEMPVAGIAVTTTPGEATQNHQDEQAQDEHGATQQRHGQQGDEVAADQAEPDAGEDLRGWNPLGGDDIDPMRDTRQAA